MKLTTWSLAALLTAALVAPAQVERASLVGNVTDKTGAAVAGVEVTVSNVATNTAQRLTTDDSGAYSAVNLIPGAYTVQASKAGFRNAIFRDYTLQVSQAARLDIQLEVGDVNQAVEVTGAAPLLQTENASVGQVISKEAVQSLPLNGRNFVQLAILSPGVTGLDYAQPNTINSGRRPDELRPGGTALAANGARSTSNQVLVDGIDNTEMISQTFIIRPAVEGIQEFKVLTNNAGAEYGRSAGAVVVITSKSGSNEFHGSLFQFLRNEVFDARNFFARPDAAKPPFKLNQYGLALGGPIKRNKTFFFADYEGYREIFGDVQLVTVPTAAMKNGDFRGVVANGIFDPLTSGDPLQPSAPIVGTAGYAGLGNARSTPLIRNQHMHELIANVSTLKGAHNLKYGVDLRFRTAGETASPPGESAFGRWNFDPAYTRNPASPGGTGDTVASMILGFPLALRRDVFLPGTATLNTNELNFYFRDEWRVNSKLTLNLGLHYEINTPFVEKKNQWVNFDPASGAQLVAGVGGVSNTGNINTDYKAWGPRISFAYQLDKKTVFRGGYGLFYEPQGNFNTSIRQFRQPPFGFVVNIPFSGNDVPTRRASDGFPITTQVPDLTRGPAFYALRGVTPNYRNGQLQQFNLAAQREVGKDMVVTLGFVASAGALLSWQRNINQPDPGAGAIDPRRPFARTLPGVTGIAWLESSANSAYTSMQLSFEKRYSKGLYLISNWTWAHGLDNVGGDGGANGPVPQDPRNRRADWSSSNADIRHRVNFAASYLLPFGQSLTGPAKYVFQGWELGAITVVQSGLPFTVTAPGSPSNTGSGSRANPVAGADPNVANRSITNWFNPAAFSTPPAFTWGTLGRNTLRGPGIFNLDLSAAKKFNFSEARRLEFRAEFFNSLNHPQFGLPGSTIGVGGVGTITNTQRANRQIQFALRYAF